MADLTLLLLLICYATSLASAVLLPPANLTLVSKNFEHILTWDEPNNESVIYYKVGYKDNGTRVSKSCSNITSRRCDLTKDLTDIMSTYTVWVYGFTDRKASINATLDFSPIMNTVLGPALVNVVHSNYNIEVFIDPPISHLWDERKQCNVTMVSDDVYPFLEYTIHYAPSGEGLQAVTLEYKGNPTVIPQLLPNTNYCVSVDVKAGSNLESSIPSAQQCVVTGSIAGSRLDVIIPVVCGSLLFLGILLTLFALDRAGYIGKRKSLIPKVLKSFSRSESRYSGSDECTSPTCIAPVEIVSQDPEIQHQESGYASRKKLLDSDTSGGDSSGPALSSNSLSFKSSGQMTTSSDEERLSSNPQIGSDIVTDSSGSFTPIPNSALESSSHLPLNNSGVFNINLNSICIGGPLDALTGLKIGDSSKEEPMEKPAMNSGHDEVPLNGDITVSNLLVDLNPTETDYGSDDYEEDLSHHADEESHRVGSGYMRR